MLSFRRSTERGPAASARFSRPSHYSPTSRLTSWGFTEGTAGADALALVRVLPVVCRSFGHVKAGAKFGIFSRFERFWLVLRGHIVILMHENYAWSESHEMEGVEQPIVTIFSVLGCEIVHARSGKYPVLRIRKRTSAHSVWMRLESEDECVLWDKALSRAASQRVVGVSDFEFISPIGKGASGKVFLVRDRESGDKLALKVIDKAKVFETRSAFRHALDERLALELVDGHPFFTRLRYAFQTRSNFYLAIDFYEGGDLYQYLRTHRGRLAEPQARIVAAEVALALDHLHSLGFVYRDLKPENVLLDSAGHVRLADFGLCKLLPPSSALTSTICGTHTYAAPEMLASRQYGVSVDLWAFGTFLYHILRGRTPYEARDLDQVIANMNNRRIRFSSNTSQELVQIIKKLLDWDPVTRIGCGVEGMAEIRNDPFFAGVDWGRVFLRAHNSDGLFAYAENVKAREAKAKLSRTSLKRKENGSLSKSTKRAQSDTLIPNKRLAKQQHAADGLESQGDARSPNVAPSAQAIPAMNQTFCNASQMRGEVYSSSGSSGSPDKAIYVENGSNFNAKLVAPLEVSELFVAGHKSYRNQSLKKELKASLWDGMAAAAVSDDLRNFDMAEWGKVSVDHDEDDDSYGDSSLWPISKTRRRLEDDRMIAGFSYCSTTSMTPLPPDL